MKISGLIKLTLLDFPDKVACTVFTAGCNLRCPFCHNASLVTHLEDAENISEEEVLSFLLKRKKVLEGVCVTGGEPLLQKDIVEFLSKVKKLGYAVKLDTNGTFPERLISLISAGLVDYVAMDVKNSREEYAHTVGCLADVTEIEKSVAFLKKGTVPYEFRTTVTGTFHTQKSVEDMGKWLKGAPKLYLQQFVDSGDLIDGSVKGCGVETLKIYRDVLSRYIAKVEIRGVDA